MINNTRDEIIIFQELKKLCQSSGYIHIIALLYFEGNTLIYNDNLKCKNNLKKINEHNVIRAELSMLIRLIYSEKIDINFPKQVDFDSYLDKTKSLLEEIHLSIFKGLSLEDYNEDNLFMTGKFLREPIFYSAESAYDFQYKDFAIKKYTKDNDWLLKNKGFTIESAKIVIDTICDIQNSKILNFYKMWRKRKFLQKDLLNAYMFTKQEIFNKSKISLGIIESVINDFSANKELEQEDFVSLSHYNFINSGPIIHIYGTDNYLLIIDYNLAQSLYESPYFWFYKDKSYRQIASKNRGYFTEEFSLERLVRVFGKNNVYLSVDIKDPNLKKGEDNVGEIDVLVIYADRAIILQAKSKKLTIEARKGNHEKIKEDFTQSIQDSYNQGFECAEFLLNNERYKFYNKDNKEINFSRNFKEIYIFCLISDYYPSVHLQTLNFLDYKTTNIIKAPLVLDVFNLDVITELLENPIYFFSYINRRAIYHEQNINATELEILSYYLEKNLLLNESANILDSNIKTTIHMPMLVRRKNFIGNKVPFGILNSYKNIVLEKIISQIKYLETSEAIELGYFFLYMDEKYSYDTNEGLKKIIILSNKDGKNHTINLESNKKGLIIHCNFYNISLAKDNLIKDMNYKKDLYKWNSCIGLCINPRDSKIREICFIANN